MCHASKINFYLCRTTGSIYSALEQSLFSGFFTLKHTGIINMPPKQGGQRVTHLTSINILSCTVGWTCGACPTFYSVWATSYSPYKTNRIITTQL